MKIIKLAEWEDGYWKGPTKDGYPEPFIGDEGNLKFPWQDKQSPKEEAMGEPESDITASFNFEANQVELSNNIESETWFIPKEAVPDLIQQLLYIMKMD